MSEIIGEFRIGEDIVVALDAVSGDVSGVSNVSAAMKPADLAGNRIEPDPDRPGIAMHVATQSDGTGWLVSLEHGATAELEEGVYGIDAKIVTDGAVCITGQTAFVRLSRAAIA